MGFGWAAPPIHLEVLGSEQWLIQRLFEDVAHVEPGRVCRWTVSLYEQRIDYAQAVHRFDI